VKRQKNVQDSVTSTHCFILCKQNAQPRRNSVAEPHHFYAALAPGKIFDAAPAPAPTLLYSKAKFSKRTKVYTHVETILFI
jgi:hypothetical protein